MFKIVLVLIICGVFATPIPKAEESRIIGGRPAYGREFPHQASLRFVINNSHFCGGSIISKGWILTAAHCVYNMRPDELFVVVGTNYLNSGGTTYYLTEIRANEAFNPQTNVEDIAVLRIKGNIALAHGIVQSIQLATFTPRPGTFLTLSGWGLTSYPSTSPSNALQTINLEAISLSQCQELLPGFPVYISHICTYMVAGEGACQGDSGGPLILNSQQQGIVSWGIPCAKGYPDVFTSISVYRNWIRSASGV